MTFYQDIFLYLLQFVDTTTFKRLRIVCKKIHQLTQNISNELLLQAKKERIGCNYDKAANLLIKSALTNNVYALLHLYFAYNDGGWGLHRNTKTSTNILYNSKMNESLLHLNSIIVRKIMLSLKNIYGSHYIESIDFVDDWNFLTCDNFVKHCLTSFSHVLTIFNSITSISELYEIIEKSILKIDLCDGTNCINSVTCLCEYSEFIIGYMIQCVIEIDTQNTFERNIKASHWYEMSAQKGYVKAMYFLWSINRLQNNTNTVIANCDDYNKKVRGQKLFTVTSFI